MENNKMPYKSEKGFTLVELSIVLVIIGLIISSVLVGQDLVRSAELRSTITQYEQNLAAIGTFKGKYNGLPGDVAGNTDFGFVGDGDNDGVFESATADEHDGEYVFFWNHLGATGAGLISGSYAGTSTGITTTDINSFTPTTKAGGNWGVFGVGGVNYFILGATVANSNNVYSTANVLTTIEAQNIDNKVDDGRPGRGLVRAGTTDLTIPNHAAGTACASAVASDAPTAASTYVTTNDNAAECTLNFRIRI